MKTYLNVKIIKKIIVCHKQNLLSIYNENDILQDSVFQRMNNQLSKKQKKNIYE